MPSSSLLRRTKSVRLRLTSFATKLCQRLADPVAGQPGLPRRFGAARLAGPIPRPGPGRPGSRIGSRAARLISVSTDLLQERQCSRGGRSDEEWRSSRSREIGWRIAALARAAVATLATSSNAVSARGYTPELSRRQDRRAPVKQRLHQQCQLRSRPGFSTAAILSETEPRRTLAASSSHPTFTHPNCADNQNDCSPAHSCER